MYDVITIGGATLDIFMKDKEFEVRKNKDDIDVEEVCMVLGDKILVNDVYFTYGGGGMNTASSLASLGLSVAYIGSIGKDDIGKGIMAKLEEKGIASDFVVQQEEFKSGLSVALHAGERERTILGFRGANDQLTKKALPENIQEKTSWIYLAHLSGGSSMCLESLAEILEKTDIKLMWNPGSTQLKLGKEGLAAMLKNTTALNINKEEAEQLTGLDVPRDQSKADDEIDDLTILFEALAETGPEIVVITDGKRGASVWNNGQIYSSKNHDIAETADTTGAGDAFGSGFLAGYISSGNIEEALDWGIIQGGAVITDFGAQNGHLTRLRMDEERKKKQKNEQ